MNYIEYFYYSIRMLSTIEKIISIISFILLTMTVSFTILDYTSKAKHINKKGW